MKPVKIAKEYEAVISIQDYGKGKTIKGVKTIDLPLFSDDGGEFTELLRCNQGKSKQIPGFTARQASWSRLLPGTIKAFHLHRQQTDVWYVSPFQRLLVGLVDLRENSPSFNIKMRLIMGAGHNKLLYIPKGVAHGAGNVWDQPATIVYFTDQEFQPQNPDESRLPYDLFGEDFWKISKG